MGKKTTANISSSVTKPESTSGNMSENEIIDLLSNLINKNTEEKSNITSPGKIML